ncbi:MAG TPA: MoaD/ThiS family protein [Nitrospira sp.]|nr:MoaD/ThiS family protein [Nitrospira sp.]
MPCAKSVNSQDWVARTEMEAFEPHGNQKGSHPLKSNEVGMVKVVILGLTLRNAVGEQELDVAIGTATTVKKLIEANSKQLGPLLDFMRNREVLITVNKKVSTEDSPVKDGDTVKLSHQSRTSYDAVRDIPT